MKKHAWIFSCLATLPLMAAEPPCPEACSPVPATTCPDPCAPTEVKQCCPCYGYLPAYHDLECDVGAVISVDFLYWFAKESNLSYVSKIKAVQSGSTITSSSASSKYLDTSWDPGVRVGLGWNLCHDGWDLALNWTYYHNSTKSSTSVPSFGQSNDFSLPATGQEALINPWINSSFHFNDALNTSARLFDKVVGKWSLVFNQLDLELGRHSWVSPCFSLRLYAALRGGWIQTTFKTESTRTAFDATKSQNVFYRFDDSFRSEVWAVGFLVGFQPSWHFGCGFMLFAHLDGALLWGDFDGKKKERYLDQRTGATSTTPINFKGQCKNDFSTMEAILDLSLGLRWERTWCCNRYRTAIDLGWENHMWFDFDHRYQTFGHFSSSNGSVQGFTSFNEVISDLMMGGLMVRLKFEF